MSLLIISISCSGFAPKPLSQLPKKKLRKYYKEYLERKETHPNIDSAYILELINWASYRRKAKELLDMIKEKVDTIEWAYKNNPNTKFNRKFIKFQVEDIEHWCRSCENRKLRMHLEDTMLNGLCVFTMALDMHDGERHKDVDRGLEEMKEKFNFLMATYHFFNHEVRYKRRIHEILMGLHPEQLDANKEQVMDACIAEIELTINRLMVAITHPFWFESIETDFIKRMHNNIKMFMTYFPDYPMRQRLHLGLYWLNLQMYQHKRYGFKNYEWIEYVRKMNERWPGIKKYYEARKRRLNRQQWKKVPIDYVKVSYQGKTVKGIRKLSKQDMLRHDKYYKLHQVVYPRLLKEFECLKLINKVA